jgi:hypothetical protein
LQRNTADEVGVGGHEVDAFLQESRGKPEDAALIL